MARKFLTPIDLNGLELLNALAQNLPGPPAHAAGRFYFDTTIGKLGISDGTDWAYVGESDLNEGAVRTIVANMFAGTETGITIQYNEATSTFDVTVPTAEAATELVAGLIEIATAEEVTAGTDPARAVTPATLAARLTAVLGDYVAEAEIDGLIRAYRLDQFAAPTGPLSMGGQRVTNVATPTADTDAATKAYVDALAQGLDPKASVRAATVANVDLTAPGTVDGVVLVAGDRVLVKNQANAVENGIYVVGTPWARAADFDASADVTPGAFTFVEEGTGNADSGWVLTTNAPIVLDTTELTFAQFSGAGQVAAGAGLTKTGNTLDVGQGTGVIVGPDSIAIDPAVVARKVAASVGDGAATAFVITHNLDTRFVQVQVYNNAAPYETVEVDVERTSVNTITVRFAVAPAAAAYRVVVQG